MDYRFHFDYNVRMEKVYDNQRHEQKLTKKGRETRARIVAVAAQLMFEHGVAGTTVEDVQREAKVSASQLYHYFADKQELVLAVIVYQTEAVLNAQEPLLSHLDSMGALRAWCDAIVQLQVQRQCQGGCPIGSLGSELSDTEPDARIELVAGFMQWEEAIRKGLRAMYCRGELKSEADPDTLALALLAALQGGLLLTKIRKETSALEAALNVMLSHIASLAA